MTTLIIVDFQKDFYACGAPLRVKNADVAADATVGFIDAQRPDRVVFTVDWHPADHCSFACNGGEWPVHCIQYSEGASLHPDILSAVLRLGIPYEVVCKGIHASQEEYGAFSRIEGGEAFTSGGSCHFTGGERLVVCGLAGDYCVLETLKNLRRFNPEVFVDGTASIDGGTALACYVAENRVRTVGLE